MQKIQQRFGISVHRRSLECALQNKKTARSALTRLILARAAEDYEVLREQLFGIERSGVPVADFSVLVRCGLAAWALGRHALARLESAVYAPVPRSMQQGDLF